MAATHRFRNLPHLIELDAARDQEICGTPLSACDKATRFAEQGAHDPTPSFYFALEMLFSQMEFDEGSWLLDVGCGTGRPLAYFAQAKLPGRATGVELDPDLAAFSQAWVRAYSQLEVIQGNALELDLGRYSHYFLFNPFDNRILIEFVSSIELAATRAVTLCHASDNGDNYHFWGRAGWSLLSEGFIEFYDGVRIYDCPQHYSLWRFDPAAA